MVAKPPAIVPELFMERLRAGMTVPAIIRGKLPNGTRIKGHSSYRAYREHVKAFPEWGKEAEALASKNAEAARFRKGVNLRRSDPTRCAKGHDLTIPENVRRNARYPDSRYPGHIECKVCLRENAKFTGKLMSPELRAKVMKAMARKVGTETIKKICHLDIFYRQRRRDPEFAAAAEQWLVGFRQRGGKKTSATCGKRRYGKIDAVVPKKLPGDVRLEIISMIFEALSKRSYQGKRFYLTQLADNMKHFIADYYKQNPVKAYGKIDSPWSLNAPVSYDSDTKLIDTVSKGLW
jgi:hypothetical protein